jgi:hypothetical protein
MPGLKAVRIDWKKSWTPFGTFMGVRPHLDPMKVVNGNGGGG